MGKKINPIILRMGITTSPTSKWFVSKRQFASYLQSDIQLRKALKIKLKDGGVSRIEVHRSAGKIKFVIYTSKPGVIIGRSGSGIEEIKRVIKKDFFGSEKIDIKIEIEEVRNPDMDAALVVQNVIYQLEKRVPFRRAMKRAIESVTQAGAAGVKIQCAGRLNGVEIARTETLVEGSIPTHTLRANIDYSRDAAQTIYGKIGIKVWIYKGQVFADQEKEEAEKSQKKMRGNRKRSSGKKKQHATKSKTRKKRTIVKGGTKKETVAKDVKDKKDQSESK